MLQIKTTGWNKDVLGWNFLTPEWIEALEPYLSAN